MTQEQYNKLAPHYEGIKFFMDNGTNVMGWDALRTIDQVAQQLGRLPADMNCNECKSNLIKFAYNNIQQYIQLNKSGV